MALLNQAEVRDRAQQGQLKVYPRGFLGAPLGSRAVKQKGLVESNRGFNMKERTVMVNQDTFDTSNPAIDELYNKYILDRETAKTFEFRERVYRVGMQAFGTRNFSAWFQAQYNNPSAGENHGRFLADTIRFLCSKRREVSLETWQSMLVIDSDADDIGAMPEEAFAYFGYGSQHRRDSDWPSTFQSWCSQPGGFEDLVLSLNILFGSAATAV